MGFPLILQAEKLRKIYALHSFSLRLPAARPISMVFNGNCICPVPAILTGKWFFTPFHGCFYHVICG
jgi:hypothetical protein